ncbi:MAG: glycosyltransferase [Spirochaetaceae bacterium]|nr:glycosyltransferase [Spirochaetaceae bacterium]
MIQEENTIIFTIRDRDGERIKSLVESARKNDIRSQFLLVDYGSQSTNSANYENICKDLGIRYLKTYTEGLPWSRARALNTGIRAANTKYVTTTDVDMLFNSNPYEEIENLIKQNSGKTVYYAMSYWLPKNGDKGKAKCAGISAKGGFQFLEKSIAEELGGYDEHIKYWGMEDLDWGNRLQKHDVNIVWLSEANRIFHKWHPNAETGFLRPYTAEYDSMRSFCRNNFNPILEQDFGKILTQEERPILKYMGTETPFERQFNANDLECFLILDEILKTREQNTFVKLSLSPRIKKGLLRIKHSILKKLSKPIYFLAGEELSPTVNKNFDFFYSSVLPALEKTQLRDYYISQELEAVYLLWDK